MDELTRFWAAAVLIGAAGAPISSRLFGRLPDRGAGLALPVGLLCTGWVYFALRSFGIFPPGRGGAFLAVAAGALASLAVLRRSEDPGRELRRTLPAALLAAAGFTAAFVLFAVFRSYVPEIRGTEQPMDLLFLNAAAVSPEYPPHDPWLAGEPASYYYFGYVQVALVTLLAGVPTEFGYNLGLALVFAATVTAGASVSLAVATLVLARPRWASVACALVLLLLVGSLVAPFEWAAAHGRYDVELYRAVRLEALLPCELGVSGDCVNLPAGSRTTAWYPTEHWFWWRATRIVPGTIIEFPIFSFMLGDLHPHLMALPTNLVAVALALVTFRRRGAPLRVTRRGPADGWLFVASAVVLGGLAFVNAWDVVTFAALVWAAAAASNLRVRLAPLLAAREAMLWAAAALALGAALYLPWWLHFRTQAGGIFPYVGGGTAPQPALLPFGPLLAAAWALLLSAAGHRPTDPRTWRWGAVLPAVPLGIWFVWTAADGSLARAVEARGLGWLTLVGYGAMLWAAAGLTLGHARRAAGTAFPLALVTLALLLLYGAELFYVRDVFADSLPRMNTVFKLSYQAWLLLSLAGGAGIVAAARRRPGELRAVAVAACALAAAGLVYPVIALPNRTGGFMGPRTLDGLAFLEASQPGERALVEEVRRAVPPGEVLVEASGRRWAQGESGPELASANVDYTDAGRVASRTGSQTPIGWYFHEIQWRGDTEENRRRFSRRQELVDQVYLARTGEEAQEALRELGADWVVLGPLEEQLYPPNFAFVDALDLAFEAEGVRLYRVPARRERETS